MGAIHALRGYRTQFLYSLNKILLENNKEYLYRPEGKFEDLDVLDGKGNYIEIIQIKNLGGNLSFSDLFSSQDSFFKRALRLLKLHENALIKIVSFGAISEDLLDNSRLSRKLKKKGFRSEDIERLLKSYSRPEIVDELSLEVSIIERLNKIRPFSDPNVLMELILFWIYQISEKQSEINAKRVISELDRIDSYISESKGFQNQFGNSIIPLGNKTLEGKSEEQLRNEFYYGISARYDHILSNLDIIRQEKLDILHKAYERTNIVFIHGASGQGKSTLAYRYLHDFLNAQTAYELKVSQNLNEVYETINTLNALCKGLNLPVTLYIDIKPQDIYWNDILKELSTKKNVRFLVTIRQEDWNRTELGVDFDFQEIELSFNKMEGQILYDNLSKYKVDLKFTSFKESWIEFGNSGLLLEYIYLINQGDKLKKRLQNQINRLEAEKKSTEIEILRFVSLSDYFNSRINYNKVLELLKIPSSLSNSYIKLLEKEYLLKFSENKAYLTGLHPIRSKILCEILFDNDDYVNIGDYQEKLVDLINEEDLHTFLLNAFENKSEENGLLDALKKKRSQTWHGLKNIFNALLWKGVSNYIRIDNKKILDDAYELLRDAWWIFIIIDFSEARSSSNPYDVLKILEKDETNQAKRIEQIEKVKERLTPSDDVFKICKDWLKSIKQINFIPVDGREWNSMGEFLFWMGYLNKEIEMILSSKDLVKYFKNSPLEIENQATVLLGLKSALFFDNKDSLRLKIEEIFLTNFRNYYKIPVFKCDDSYLRIEYFFELTDDFAEESTQLESKTFNPILDNDSDIELPSENSNIFHQRTIKILDIVRKAFPNQERYIIHGIGHKVVDLGSNYDPTYKNIPRENIPIKYLVRLNGLVIHLFDYNRRVESWEQYVSAILGKREEQLQILREFRKGLLLYFRNETKGINFFIENEEKIKRRMSALQNYQLPRIIADKWGYYGDSTRENIGDYKVAFSMLNFKKFTSLKADYFFSVRNYINNSYLEIGNTLKRLNGKFNEIENKNLTKITEINIADSFRNLIRFNNEFENKFAKYTESEKLKQLVTGEIGTITSLITIWKAFVYSKYRYQPSILKKSSINFNKTKIDLKLKVLKEYKKLFMEGGFLKEIIESEKDKSLVFLLNVTRQDYINILGICFDFIVQVFGGMLRSSMKKVLVELNYEKVTFILLFDGKPLNDKFFEIPINRIDYLTQKINEGFEFKDPLEIFDISEEFDESILLNNNLRPWSEVIAEIKLFEEAFGLISAMKYVTANVHQVINGFEQKDALGNDILEEYLNKVIKFIDKQIVTESRNKITKIKALLDNRSLSERINLAKNLVALIENYILAIEKINKPEILQLEEAVQVFSRLGGFEESYETFSEIMIGEHVA